MAPVPNTRPTPTTDRESALLDALAEQLRARALDVDLDVEKREITARQPAVTGNTPDAPPVGLSQALYLTRHRTDPDRLAWMIRLDDGFRGANGQRFEPIADGDDVAQAARRVGNILALVDGRTSVA